MKTKHTLLAALMGSMLFAGVAAAQDTTDTPVVPQRDQIRQRLHDLVVDFRAENADLIAARERLRVALKDATAEERAEMIARFREQYAERIESAREARKQIRTQFLEERKLLRQRIREHMQDHAGDGAGAEG